MKCVVRQWCNVNGYGFLTSESGKDIFVHYTAIIKDGYKELTIGQEVECDVYETSKGYNAQNVKTI